MIADKREILARIRVRSTPLQGDDCSSLRQGDHVLATKNSHVKSLFHDARVEEVYILICILKFYLLFELCSLHDKYPSWTIKSCDSSAVLH